MKNNLTIWSHCLLATYCNELDALYMDSAFDNVPHLLKNYTTQWLCGSVGRAVASNTRGQRFESSHRLKFINTKIIIIINSPHGGCAAVCLGLTIDFNCSN